MKNIHTAAMALLLLTAGCATVSNPFVAMKPNFDTVPRAALERTALLIERAIAAEDRDAAITPPEGITLADAAVRQVIRTRTLRHSQIASLLKSGHVYEIQNGLIKIKNSGAYKQDTTREERDRDALLVQRENQDRWTLYEGIVEENNWSAGALSAVQSVFFDVRIQCLAPGEHYEASNGEPIAKVR